MTKLFYVQFQNFNCYFYPGLTVSHVSNWSQGVQHANLVYRQQAIKAWAPGQDTSPEILPVSVQ